MRLANWCVFFRFPDRHHCRAAMEPFIWFPHALAHGAAVTSLDSGLLWTLSGNYFIPLHSP